MSSSANNVIKEFLLESNEALSNISEELTRFEKNPNELELIHSIFRKIHTLKGSASFLGFRNLQKISHEAETALDLVRSGVLKIEGTIVDILLESFDVCANIISRIESTGSEGTIQNLDEIISKVKSIHSTEESFNNIDDASLVIEFENKEDLLGVISKNEKILKLEDIKEKTIKDNEPSVKVDNDKKADMAINSSSVSSLADSVVRVNVNLLDKIMNVVGELVLNRNQILQYANIENNINLSRLAQQLNTITSELQTDIMKTRMQPVGSVLNKFERVIRDLARNQNKEISLNLVGKDTELDKTLLEAIKDPLTHLVRNACDHGVETPEKRKECGKNSEGLVTIKSYHESGQVTIEISDDGNGVNTERVAQIAVDKGLFTNDQIEKMSEQQIHSLIFAPGFSTAESVTNISGRGVGMDVVKSNIEKIGGTVDIISKSGKGTTFKLKIPLTLAIIPALIVQSRELTFSIPQINLVELVRIDSEKRGLSIEKIHNSEFIRLRGDLIPVFRLSPTLDLEEMKSKKDKLNTLVQKDLLDHKSKEVSNDDLNVVILSADGQNYGLIVDEVIDTEEIVVKPLSRELKKLQVFAGSTIMGDGSVSLILDVGGYYNKMQTTSTLKTDQEKAIKDDEKEFNDIENIEILLCRLGDNSIYSIPLNLVNRLEEFPKSKIEWSGDRPLVRYRDRPMPLINIEKTLGLQGESSLLVNSENERPISCIVVENQGKFYGLVVDEIADITHSDSELNSEIADRKGLMGTVFVNEKIITVLDVFSILDMNSNEGNSQNETLFSVEGVSNGQKILIVEDSALYRKVESERIREAGYNVIVAKDGVEGLEALTQNPDVDLVLTDIEMPKMDGYELAKAIRTSDKAFSNIPIIALTSRVGKDDLDRGKESGFNEHLEKFDASEVLKTIKKLQN